MSFNRDRERGFGARAPQQPPLPKPYDFVPLPEGRVATRGPAGHHRYHADSLTGSLRATIIARSPVHVASGLLEQMRDRDYPLVKAHFRTGGTPAIPGTSLKGCIRSIAEAISGSAVQVTRARELSRDYQPSRSPDQLDVAQRIFGTLGYQGMLRFGDALQVAGGVITVPTPQLFRPRPESTATYFDGRRPWGRKFYMHGKLATGNLPLEACAEGSRFALQMEFENLSRGELGLILIALGLGEPQLWPKLGGGKPACLGTIEVERESVSLVAFEGAAAYSDFDAVPQAVETSSLIGAAGREGLILEMQLQKAAEILKWPRQDRDCPYRNY